MTIFNRLLWNKDRHKISKALTDSWIEPRAVPPKYSGKATVPQYWVTSILIEYKYLKSINWILKFLLAFTRAGVDSLLTLNSLGLLLRGKGLLAVKVRPIQSSFRSFSLRKKTCAFERTCGEVRVEQRADIEIYHWDGQTVLSAYRLF
jgi:hypothetical protein